MAGSKYATVTAGTFPRDYNISRQESQYLGSGTDIGIQYNVQHR